MTLIDTFQMVVLVLLSISQLCLGRAMWLTNHPKSPAAPVVPKS